MKKIILFSIILQTNLFSFSQLLTNENKMWCNTIIGTEGNSHYESYYIKFLGDTAINNEHYKFIMRSDNHNHENWYTYGLIIEDSINELVYLYDKKSELKNLLYDFSVEKSDSIEYDGNYYTVDSVNYKTFGSINEPCKHIYFENRRVWIKGIGSPRGVLEGVSNLPLSTGATFDLVCYYENDIQVYHNNNYNDCFFSTDVKNTKQEQKLIHYWISEGQTINVKLTYQNKGIFTLYNYDGKKIGEKVIENINVQIDLPYSGMYIYLFENEIGLVESGKIIIN